MIPVTVFLPLRDNDELPFARADFRFAEDAFLALAGGWTDAGRGRGEWLDDDGSVYADETVRYEVALRQWVELPRMLALVETLRARFRQEALHVVIAGVPENVGPATQGCVAFDVPIAYGRNER